MHNPDTSSFPKSIYMLSYKFMPALAAPLCIAVLALPPTPAAAQSASARNAADPPSLGATTVNAPAYRPEQQRGPLATGTDASMLETPFSVTTVPADAVREQAGTTLQDALRNVPGAQADSGFNGSHTQFIVLRGAVTDSGTLSNRVLRDGVRLSNYPYVPAFIERVEVLRGPGAAVGVRSEPGGTVNLVTRQPLLANFGSVLVRVGSHGEFESSLDVNRVLSEANELAARVSATRSDASEWRHVQDRVDGVKFGLAKSDGDRLHLRAGFEATNQAYRADYGIPALNGRPVAVPRDRQLGEPFGDSTTDNRIFDLHGDVALGADSRVALDFTHLSSHATAVRNGLFGNPLPNQPVGTWGRFLSVDPDTGRRIDSLAASLTSRLATGAFTHRTYFGLELYRETLDQPSLSIPAAFSPSINVFAPVYGRVTEPPAGTPLARSLTTQDLESATLSAQDQIDYGPWSLVAGVRFMRQNFLYGTEGVKQVREARWSPKVGVLRHLSDRATVYANVSTGTSPNQVSSSSNQSLPSRRSTQYEAGVKKLWQDGRVSTELAVYRLNQKNMIASDSSTPNPFDFTTAGSARSQGLEASLTGRVSRRLDAVVTYAYTDARYQDNPVYGGQRVPNVARHAASVWGQYRWDAQWRSGAGIYAQGARFADELNTTTLPGYARIDLVQAWTQPLGAGRSVELQLAVRNVFDRQYFVSSHLHVSRWITPGQGRNFALSAAYRF